MSAKEWGGPSPAAPAPATIGRRRFIAAGGALALAGCGGGGGGGTATAEAAGAPTPAPAPGPAPAPTPAPGSAGYSVPGVGQAVAIGTNFADDVRPAGASASDWAYANFNGYGAGCFASEYSNIGAYVISGCGGHGAPGNLDALIFDFADATWKRLANAAGVAFIPNGDITQAQSTGQPWLEIASAGSANVPAPSHTYNTCVYLPPALGGGSKGSFVKMGQWATTTVGAKSGAIHRLDLATGVWSRMATALPADDYEDVAVADESSGRVYFFQQLVHRTNYTTYLESGALKTTATYPYPPDHGGAEYHVVFVDPVRRLLIQQQPGWPLRCLQLDNFAAGWKDLNVVGTQPAKANRIIYYPTTGNFYTRLNNSGNALIRLVPPASNPLVGTWTWDTVSVGGASLPDFTSTASNDGRRHYGTFFRVPALDCFAWISGESTKVVLLKPPA